MIERISKLSSMTIDQIVQYFAETAIAQEEAILGSITDETDPTRPMALQRTHELDLQLRDIDAELRKRGREARLALMKLYEHPNAQVNLEAAHYTLGVEPAAARHRIQAIADSEWAPQYIQARSIIKGLESGRFKPD